MVRPIAARVNHSVTAISRAARMRRTFVTILGVLSVLALLSGTVYTYVARTFFNPDVFASRVADGLQEPALAEIVANELADEVIALRQDLIAYRPLIVGSLVQVVKSTPFRAVVQRAVKETHQTMISRTGENVALTAGDLGVVVRNALATNPELKDKVPAKVLDALGSTSRWAPSKRLTRLLQLGHRMRMRAFMLLVVGLVLGVTGFALSHRKDVYLMQTGFLMAVAGFVIGVVARFGGAFVAPAMGTGFSAKLVRGLWPAFVGPMALRMWVFSGMGIVLVAGVTSTFARVDLKSLGRILWRGVENRPGRLSLGLLRGALLVTAGIIAAFHPTITIQVAIVGAAGILFFLGVQELFAVIVDGLPRFEDAVMKHSGRGTIMRGIIVSTLVLALIAAGAFWLRREDTRAPVPELTNACNGYSELCDRRLNEVAFATSHNSMSGGDIQDWMFPNQDRGIPAQLEDGVRGFLVDVHYGVPVGDRVKTLLEDEAAARAQYEEVIGKEAVDAAMRIRDRLVGRETGKQDVYLAHGFCELGATRFVDMLSGMRDFLVMHPSDVVIMIIQDEGVTPEDVAGCFERSGLIEMVYRGPVVKPWPTLGEMADANQRVLVMAEHHSEGVAWYHPAFEVCQETPYGFKTPEEFSNRPNRGGTRGSLLLMNHWIETTPTPLPSNAKIVNAYDFLLKRALACKKERGMMPNLVAVDFYRTGDLFRVVDTLNGVKEPQTAAK